MEPQALNGLGFALTKWSYRFKDQFGNFTNANIVLMCAMDVFRSKGLFDPEGAKT